MNQNDYINIEKVSNMNALKFSNLSHDACADYLFRYGDYITHREYYNQVRILYSCNSFLAEAWYDPMEHEVTEVTIIGLEKALKFYWRSIQIDSLNCL